jgi:hypothetical protein
MHQCDGTLANCPYMQGLQADQEFRQNVLSMLTDVQTKMNALVGKDGTNGRVGSIDDRVKSLEGTRANQWGAVAAVSVIWTIVLAIFEHLRK